MSRYYQKFVLYKQNGESHLIEGSDIFNALKHHQLNVEPKDFYILYSAKGDMPKYIFDTQAQEWVSNANDRFEALFNQYGILPYTTSVLVEEELLAEEAEATLEDVI